MDITDHPILGKRSNEKLVTIAFEGKELKAWSGQTVASVLMANNIVRLGRSRKLLQPRGVFCGNGRCCSCFMTIDGREHVRSCMTPVAEGMQIRTNEGDPDVRRDPHAN